MTAGTVPPWSRPTGQIDPWIHRYVFPGANLPTLAQITDVVSERFVVEDVQSLGPDSDRPLHAWHDNFEEAWPRLRDRYDERFRQLWRYYLLSCARAFPARKLQVFQVASTRRGTARPTSARAV